MTTGVRLRDLGFGVRAGLSLLILVMLGGFVAAAFFMKDHHHKRDEVEGLSVTDIKGVYHGVKSTAPLISALEANHPETLTKESRDILLKWLRGTRLSEDYDNPELGDLAPSEIIAANCNSCHARTATAGEGIGQKMPLESWEDVKRVAFSRDIQPNSIGILLASTHTHALSMSSMAMVSVLMLAFTRWPGGLVGLVSFLIGAGLLTDIGGWWLARLNDQFAYAVAIGGLLYNVGMGIALVMTLLDMWWPRRTR